MVQRIVLYGAGRRCKTLCNVLRLSHVEIAAVVDSDPNKWGQMIEGHRIESPDVVKDMLDMNICITLADGHAVKAVREELQQIYHYDIKREIHYFKLLLTVYLEDEEVRQKILEKGKERDDKGKNVLFSCIHGFTLGGIQAWTKDICEALVKSGKKDIYVIANKEDYEIPFLLKEHMICVDVNPQGQFLKDSILNVIESIMKILPCKIITTQVEEITLAVCLIKHYLPNMVDMISTIRGSNEMIYQNHMDFIEYPDIHIGVSQDIKDEMIRLGVKPEKVYSMCVPFECEEVLNRSYTEKNSLPIRIGYAGRMDKMERSAKRLDLLLKLILVLAEKNISFEMELAGDGPARKEMEDFVSNHYLMERVKFVGMLDRSNIPAFWKKQDICVNISDYEGRSHSIIEAMGNGAVPVVTATSGVREDIINDVNGYIVPIGDYKFMAERIEYLEQHRERLSVMGKLAHDAVYPKSRIETHLAFWEEILSKESTI